MFKSQDSFALFVILAILNALDVSCKHAVDWPVWTAVYWITASQDVAQGSGFKFILIYVVAVF